MTAQGILYLWLVAICFLLLVSCAAFYIVELYHKHTSRWVDCRACGAVWFGTPRETMHAYVKHVCHPDDVANYNRELNA